MMDICMNGVRERDVTLVKTEKLDVGGFLVTGKTTTEVGSSNKIYVKSSFVEVAPSTGVIGNVQNIYLANDEKGLIAGYATVAPQGTIIHLTASPTKQINFVTGGNLNLDGANQTVYDYKVIDFIYSGFAWVFMSGTACSVM